MTSTRCFIVLAQARRMVTSKCELAPLCRRITDPEILERRYPVILREYQLRPGSGGDGEFRGGDGVIREVITTLSQCRPAVAGAWCRLAEQATPRLLLEDGGERRHLVI